MTKELTSMKEMIKKVLACFHLQAMVTGAMAGIGFWGIFWEIRRVDPNWRYAVICAALAGAGLAGVVAVFSSAYWSQKRKRNRTCYRNGGQKQKLHLGRKTTENRHVTNP
ncbi:hypothetical protein SDD30_15780 [Moorella naiadis]|uniref:hypothetical protein n=1 Tax=Moorella naiadis (nom. illeg.) TaxID=3093670 RepID=UPI003D9C8446